MENITYDEFIQNILDTRGRFNCGNEYHERHHIIPKCMGGGNEEENLIDLFAREHFIAHRLLSLENPENSKLVYAYICMAFVKNDYEHRYELTPEEYEEARIALSKANTGEGNIFYGKCHTEETKQLLSELKGIPVVQLDKSGNFIGSYKSAKEASIQTGVDMTTINKCCLNKTNCLSGGGFLWIYKKNYNPNDPPIYQLKNVKPVVQLDKKGNFINEYDSIINASKSTSVCETNILNCCKGIYGHAGGFIWRYSSEYNNEDNIIYENKLLKPVIQLNYNGDIINKYASISTASELTGVKVSNIINCCKRIRQTSGGFVWRYANEDYDIEEIKKMKPKKAYKHYAVLQYDKNMNLLSEFSSAAEAARQTNVSATRIRSCCNEMQKYASGFIWKWKLEKKE